MNLSNGLVTTHRQPQITGFSLVEVLIAITTLAALLAIAIPQYQSYRSDAMISQAIGELRMLDNQLKSYKVIALDKPQTDFCARP